MFEITNVESEDYIIKMRKVFDDIGVRKISETVPLDIGIHLDFTNQNYREVVFYRDKYIQEVGFARISKDWIRPLAKWIGGRKCLEIMAGSGALTYALKEEGVKIRATDDFSWSKGFAPWIQVENLDCIAAIEKYGKEISFIICSWPYMDETAYRALLKMREVNPQCRMIYIGEGSGGCTADSNFFETLTEVHNKGFNYAIRKYSRWYGLKDKIYLVK